MPKSPSKKPEKIFAVRDNKTGEVSRLVQASKKGDVIKHLAAAFAVDELGAVDATSLVMSGMVVEHAAATVEPTQLESAQAGDGSAA